MHSKHFLLALALTSLCSAGRGHIVTSSFVDMPLAACMRSLTSIRNFLCESEPYMPMSEHNLPEGQEIIVPRMLRWEVKEQMIKICCRKPCSVAELKTLC